MNKTAMKILHKKIKEMIPAAGINEEKLTQQRAYSNLSGEIKREYIKLEKEQLREAFEMGAASVSIINNKPLDLGELDKRFEQYYSKYED